MYLLHTYYTKGIMSLLHTYRIGKNVFASHVPHTEGNNVFAAHIPHQGNNVFASHVPHTEGNNVFASYVPVPHRQVMCLLHTYHTPRGIMCLLHMSIY